MVEGELVFKEAIEFLNTLPLLKPLIWDENLSSSAMDHVLDIGPKGLLSYQSSDGTEPEERISRYGNYVESLGENIDFGPNDSIGVIVSLTLDDGEPDRPHRENLFKSEYLKIGIACGPHKTEYQMCVMDFAYDFVPFSEDGDHDEESGKNINLNLNTDISSISQITQNTQNKNSTANGIKNEKNHKQIPSEFENNNFNDNKPLYSESTNKSKSGLHVANNNPNSHSPLVRLSLDKDEYKNFTQANNNNMVNTNTNINVNYNNNNNNKIDQFNNNPVATFGKPKSDITEDNQSDIQNNLLADQIKNINLNKKVISKFVEVTTKIIYTYEDGSSREVIEKQNHTFNLNNN